MKAINPRCKVLSYWNVFLAYPQYTAHEQFTANPDWLLRDSADKPFLIRGRVQTYDLSVRAMRQWWINVAAHAAKEDHIDGVFVDAVPKIGMLAEQNRRNWGAAKYEAVESGLWQMMQQLRTTLGPSELVIFNGLRGDHQRWSDGGSRYLRVTSGAMVEHFGHFSARTRDGRLNKERMAVDLELISRAGREGKIVIVKGWPGFSWMEPHRDNATENLREARSAITFPLACFLIAAEKSSYFCYSWGYHHNDGGLAWYPEYDKPLGPPRGPARRDGWIYTRQFEHANVWVDLEQELARIEFRDGE